MELRGNKEESFKDKYFNIFGDLYRFMNISYKLALENDWQAIINEVISIENKYKDNKFVCDLIVSVLGELEKVSETKRKE